MKKRTRTILSLCIAVFLIFGITGYAYVSNYYHADETALAVMAKPADSVEIQQNGDVLWFIPENPTAGLIFYPGGKVEYTAYAPLMQACAEQGILCGLVKMPCNLAVLNVSAAEGLPSVYPDIINWHIGGHSLGGAMAANYAASHAEEFAGVILLAAYSTKDLSETSLKVLSVYGSEDGVMKRESYDTNRGNLPACTTELVLEGGCHAQFGSYGPQDGDGTPTISGEEQISQTAEAIDTFVNLCP